MESSIPELCNDMLERLYESDFEPETTKVQTLDASVGTWEYMDTTNEVKSFTEEKYIEEILLEDTEPFERLINSDEVFSNLYDDLVQKRTNYCDEQTAINHVIQAIKRYLSRNDKGSGASTLRTKISSDLKEAVSKNKHECKVKFFVHGVETEQGLKLDLGEVEIRKPTNKEIADHVVSGNLDNCPGSVFKLKKELNPDFDKHNIKAEVQDKIRSCSLIGISHPKIGAVKLSYPNDVIKNKVICMEPEKSDFSTHLNDAAAESLQEVKSVFEDIESGSYLEVAQRRYEKATKKDKSDIDRLVDAVIGLDAIYTDEGSELSHKVTHRCTLMTSLLGEEPVQTRKMVRGAYNKRSNFVHGETPSSPSDDMLMKTLDCLRKSIIIFSQIGKEEDRQNLFSYTDKSFISVEERRSLEEFVIKNVPEKLVNTEKMLIEANK
jgi:hypothetical protein